MPKRHKDNAHISNNVLFYISSDGLPHTFRWLSLSSQTAPNKKTYSPGAKRSVNLREFSLCYHFRFAEKNVCQRFFSSVIASALSSPIQQPFRRESVRPHRSYGCAIKKAAHEYQKKKEENINTRYAYYGVWFAQIWCSSTQKNMCFIYPFSTLFSVRHSLILKHLCFSSECYFGWFVMWLLSLFVMPSGRDSILLCA